jgi:hypothetical protein
MPAIFKFFWFLFAAAMAGNIIVWRSRASIIVARGTVTRAELDRLLQWAAVWLVGTPIVLGLIALTAGWSSPFCAGILTFGSVPQSLTSLVTLAAWVALLLWIWRGSGADLLARLGPSLSQRPAYDAKYSAKSVRVIATALVLLGGLGASISWRVMPASPAVVCPATTRTG